MDQFVTKEVTETLECAPVFETGNGVDELSRDNFVL
jgi:hypothetical protein